MPELDLLPPIGGLSFEEEDHRYVYETKAFGVVEPASVSKVLAATGAKAMNYSAWRKSLMNKGMSESEANEYMESHRQTRAQVGTDFHSLAFDFLADGAPSMEDVKSEQMFWRWHAFDFLADGVLPMEDVESEEMFWRWHRDFSHRIGLVRLIEQPLIHKGAFYVGTPDLVGMVDGQLTLVDWKTAQPGKERVRSEWRLQIAAYAAMVESCYGIRVERGMNVVVSSDRVLDKTWNRADLDLGWKQFLGYLVEYHASMASLGHAVNRVALANLAPLFHGSVVQ